MNKLKLQPEMQIELITWKDNTHYSVTVQDKYGNTHHLGYIPVGDIKINGVSVVEEAERVCKYAKPPSDDEKRQAKWIEACIESDKKHGIKPTLD